jgi:hypothetical protein
MRGPRGIGDFTHIRRSRTLARELPSLDSGTVHDARSSGAAAPGRRRPLQEENTAMTKRITTSLAALSLVALTATAC